MSVNELKNKEEVEARKVLEELKSKKKGVRTKRKKSSPAAGRTFVQIMNGEFLSKDWFVGNLPYTFFVGFLLVVLIGWGYYTETVIKEEVKLKSELSDLESEFFTLSSEYIAKRGRDNIKEKLPANGPVENRVSPHKFKVKRFDF